MVENALLQPSAILPFDPDAITRAVQNPEDGDGERYVIMNDDLVPYSTYRSSFHTAWERSLSGLQVSEQAKQQAYAISAAAFAATQYRCLTISQVPGVIVDQSKNDPVEWHPLIGFMPYMGKLMWQIEVSLLIWGVCYLKKVYNRYGYPSSLCWVHPEDITPQTDQYDEVYEYYERMSGVAIKRHQMVEIRTFDPDRSLQGKSAYEVAMSHITTERNLVMHAGSFFFNSARPDGILVSKTRLDKEGKLKAKKDWEQFKGSGNAWQTFVSGGDWDWIPITIPPVDLAMTELKDGSQKDVCAIFRTNGALIGLASVSDPLSAGSTLATVKRNHVEAVTLPEYNDIAHDMNTQWLWTDFDEKNYYTLIANEADMPILSDVSGEMSTVAVNLTNPLNPVVDYDEARKFMNLSPREGYIGRPPDQSLAMVNGTLITVNEGRQFLSLEPYQIDMLKTPDGKLIRASDLGKYLDATMELIVSPPAPPAGGGFGGGFGLTGGQPMLPSGGQPQPPTAPTPNNPYDAFRLPLSNSRSGSGCAVVLQFSGDELVRSIQTILKTQLPDSIAHVWCDPKDFHLTLYQCEVCSMAQETELYSALNVTKPLPVMVKGTTSFQQDGYMVLVLQIEPSEELVALQSKIYEKAESIGITSSSDYSEPSKWKPHITVAYLDPETPIEESLFNVQVQPTAIAVTKSEYQPTYTKDIAAAPKEEVGRGRRSNTPYVEVAVDFANNAFLKTAQRVLSHWAATEGGIEVNWYDPATLRMPLIEMQNLTSMQAARAMELVSSAGMARADVYTGEYAIRDGQIGVVVAATDEVDNIRSAAMLQLDELADTFHAEGWSPFVPLGAIQGESEARSLWASDGYPLVLSAITMYTGTLRRGRWELRHKTQVSKELVNWQRVVERKGRDHWFTPEYAGQLVSDFVRSALQDTDATIDEVFARAKEIEESGLTYVDPDIEPTPEEALEYWRNYDEAKADIGQDWYSYMTRVLPDILSWIKTETKPSSVTEVLARHHDKLRDDWVGTEENPGALYSVVLAGMAAGNEALVKGVSMNPESRVAKVGVAIEWDLLSTQARDFARQYTYKLIKGIDATTARMVQGIFDEWTTTGKPFTELAKALEVVFKDKQRAAQIAQTEGIRVYNEGAFKRWTDVGVKRAKWRTVQDGIVCRVCKPLNGQVADMKTGWISPSRKGGFKTYTTSAHSGCRCFRTPDTTGILEDVKQDYKPVKVVAPAPPPMQVSSEFVAPTPARVAGLDAYRDLNTDEPTGRIRQPGDPVLGEIYKRNGYDGRPNVVTPETIDQLRADGHRIVYRGVTDAKFAEQFRDGEYFPGLGIYGNGTYTAVGSDADNHTDALDTAREYATEQGYVMRMAIHKDAKIVTLKEIQQMAQDELEASAERVRQARKAVYAVPHDHPDAAALEATFQSEKARDNDVHRLVMDEGRYASIMGYDGVLVERNSAAGQGIGDYLVMLNRTAIAVDTRNWNGKVSYND